MINEIHHKIIMHSNNYQLIVHPNFFVGYKTTKMKFALYKIIQNV